MSTFYRKQIRLLEHISVIGIYILIYHKLTITAAILMYKIDVFFAKLLPLQI